MCIRDRQHAFDTIGGEEEAEETVKQPVDSVKEAQEEVSEDSQDK